MSTAADDDAAAAETDAPTTTELASRIDGINAKLDAVIGRLGGARDQAHAAAEQHTEERLDRPTSIAEEIRQQLDAQKAADEKAAAERGQADRLAAVEQRIAGMAEQTPQPPQRRVEKFLGWR
jgi:predicted metal-dependent hydrolase